MDTCAWSVDQPDWATVEAFEQAGKVPLSIRPTPEEVSQFGVFTWMVKVVLAG